MRHILVEPDIALRDILDAGRGICPHRRVVVLRHGAVLRHDENVHIAFNSGGRGRISAFISIYGGCAGDREHADDEKGAHDVHDNGSVTPTVCRSRIALSDRTTVAAIVANMVVNARFL